MPVISPQDSDALKKRFSVELKRDVRISLFTLSRAGGLIIPGRECATCGQTQELLEEVAALSPRIKLEVHDFYAQSDEAKARGVERIPAVVMGADGRSNVKYYGIPSGFEFATLVEDIIVLSKAVSPLKIETRKALRKLKQDAHIQVFVTPGCQYCPAVARLAHAMAIESPKVTADVIEVQEFPALGRAHQVMGVPKTIINDTIQFTGAVSEDIFLRRLLEAVGELPKAPGQPQEEATGATTILTR